MDKESVAHVVPADLDQFYTCPVAARSYAESVMRRWPEPGVLFVEPSAGTGAFFLPVKEAGRKIRALDLVPGISGISRGDFLGSDHLFEGSHAATVVLGNPPFGRNSSLAVRFFNHAARYADEIAFILPRTFRKTGLHRRLHPQFHLTDDMDVGRNSFIRFGNVHDVPCVWQVWTRKTVERPDSPVPDVSHLMKYVTPETADFAIRRVGYYAGRVVTSGVCHLSRTTHYFVREMVDGVIDVLRDVDWSDIVSRTVGVRSLSKTEIAFMLERMYHAE